MQKNSPILVFTLLLTSLAAAAEDCPDYAGASQQLKKAHDEDQRDRMQDEVLGAKINERDEERRQLVGNLFEQGCFRSAEDYYHGAMVFQHGDKPEHYQRAYQWAMQATKLVPQNKELGKDSLWLTAAGIDRYLVSIGHKQLFATQYFRPLEQPCWCLRSVERSFPAFMIPKYTGKTIDEKIAHVAVLNKGQLLCEKVTTCLDDNLKPTPTGTLPGLW